MLRPHWAERASQATGRGTEGVLIAEGAEQRRVRLICRDRPDVAGWRSVLLGDLHLR